MKIIPHISDSEWKVMKILWNKSPQTANEIIAKLAKSTDWKPTTIKTLLSRLVRKNALRYEKMNRTYHYYTLIPEKDCVKAESQSFLKKVYGGALKPLVANFLDLEQLTEEDIEELKHILEGKKK